MNMQEKNQIIENYIRNKVEQINNQYDNLIDEDKISKLIDMFKDSNEDLEIIKDKINQLINSNLSKLIIDKFKSEMPNKNIIIENIIKSMTGTINYDDMNLFLTNHFNEIYNLSEYELATLCLDEFRKSRNYDIQVDHDLPIVLQDVLNSREFEDLMSDVLSNTNTAGEHNDLIVDGSFLSHNLLQVRKIINFIAQYVIIHKGSYDIENIYSALKSTNINEISDSEIEQLFNKLIVSSISKKFNLKDVNSLESKKFIFNYIYSNFIDNGFCFQGINGIYESSVLKNGLTTRFSNNNNVDLKMVDEIFKKHGLDKLFYSKLDEIKEAPYYYLTDDMGLAFHYSYHNPEYFVYLVAIGNNMPDHEYDRKAYYMRDYESCKNNLNKLCRNYKLENDEIQIVMDCFNKLWQQNVGNLENNSIVMVQRSLINRNKVQLDNIDFNETNIIDIVSQLRKSNYLIDKHYDDISSNKIDVIKVPMLSKFYKKDLLENMERKKYLRLSNNHKYYYDILINVDQADYDCITIDDTIIPRLETINSVTGKSIDIIHCNDELDENSILSNGEQSFQSIEMMIAVNGIANSDKGKLVIEKARKKYSPEYMRDYYYHLCQLSCTIALDSQHFTPTQRASAIVRMAKDFFPKAELMRATNNYPQYIDEDAKIYSYMDYPIRKILNEVNDIRNSNNGSDVAIKKMVNYFQTNINGKINYSFTQEFNQQLEKLNFTYGMINNPKNNNPQSSFNEKKCFDRRSQTEVDVAQQIREKNMTIKKQKEQKRKMNKLKVKTLTTSSPQSSNSNGSKGFANTIILSLIVSFVAGALFTVVYMLIGR